MPDSGANGFGMLDWLVVGGYLALLVGVAIVSSRRAQSSTREYFRGGGRIPAWAVALSIVATATSAATFVGGPEESFKGNLSYLVTNLGTAAAAIVVALLFIPAFYRHKVTTVYELLGDRVGEPARLAASGAFLIGRVMASGARVFIGALPLALILFGDTSPQHIAMAVGILVIGGVGFTIIGGITSVIWTDAVQTIVFVGAGIAAVVVLLNLIPLSPSEVWNALQTSTTPNGTPKLEAAPIGIPIHLSQTYTVITAFTGFFILAIGAFGTDQDLTQRMLTCKSASRGSLSLILAIIANIPVVIVFLSVGLLLYVFYSRPDIMGQAAPTVAPADSRAVFLSFIVDYVPRGLAGLMVAGLLAAGLSSLNSALNAMSSAFVTDFYRKFRAGKEEQHYVNVARIMILVWAVALAAMAIACEAWQRGSGDTLISFALRVMIFAYAGLVGVFACVLILKRGSSTSVIAALLTGFGIVVAMEPWARSKWAGALHLDQLAQAQIAWPWTLTLGTTIAFIICAMGKPTPGNMPPKTHHDAEN